jgi:ankyrin repeat protein
MLDDLLEACRRNDLERVQSLVTADPTLLTRQGSSGETPLLTAIYHRSGETVAWLSQRPWPRTVFEAAAIDDAERVMELLADDPHATDTYSADGWTPLHLAAFFGAARAADLLLSHGADPRRIARNAMANTPLHAALAAKRLALVELLLASGADPALECSGYTPLAIAESGGFEAGASLVRRALDAGAVT